MSDHDKGYFSHGAGSGHSHEFQQGVWARQAEERRAREAEERAAREREQTFARALAGRQRDLNPGFEIGFGASSFGAARPRVGFGDAVRSGVIVGAVLCLLYAVLMAPRPGEAWLPYALAGGCVGAAAGGALHLALIVLRWALVALAWGFGLLLIAGVASALWEAL